MYFYRIRSLGVARQALQTATAPGVGSVITVVVFGGAEGRTRHNVSKADRAEICV